MKSPAWYSNDSSYAKKPISLQAVNKQQHTKEKTKMLRTLIRSLVAIPVIALVLSAVAVADETVTYETVALTNLPVPGAGAGTGNLHGPAAEIRRFGRSPG